jgi:SAM-dependent methyltransferase
MPASAPLPADRSARFAGRVDDFERGRPGYPEALFDRLLELSGLGAGAAVADVGSGTGLATAPLLRRGLRVFAVEPNAEMRLAAERQLGGVDGFESVAGRAEATGLADASVDLALAAQAFHWFEPRETRRELRRILRPGAPVALVWNARRADGTPFVAAYEDLLLRHGTDYREVGHRGLAPERLAAFYGGSFDTFRFDNEQTLDREGLRARLLSSSYVPAAGEPGHPEMLRDLDELFDRHTSDGAVRLLYDVDLFFGELAGD